MKHELERYIASPFAVQKAERIRKIVQKAEEAGIRAEPDIDDADLLLGLDFRIVPAAYLQRVLDLLERQTEGNRALMALVAREVPKERLEAIYREEREKAGM